MKRIMLMLLFGMIVPGLAWPQPSITFNATKHDFGTVMQGPQLEHTFEVTNKGTEELVIKDVNTS